MSEVWKDVEGTDGYYQVSSNGRARSVVRIFTDSRGCTRRFRGGYLALSNDGNGYLRFCTNVRGKRKDRLVHVEVLRAFAGERPDGMECCHGNGNRQDNRIANLRWGTRLSNALDKRKHGTIAVGAKAPCAKLTEEQVLDILNSSESHIELARKYSVSGVLIGKIRNGEAWAYIKRTPAMFTKKVKVWIVNGRQYKTLPEAAEAEGVKIHVLRYRCAGRKSGGVFYPPAEGHGCLTVKAFAAEQGVRFTTADHWGIAA